MRWLIYIPVIAVLVLVACTSTLVPPDDPGCVSARDIERMNGFAASNRLFELNEKEARVFLSLDPRLMDYEYDGVIEQGIDRLVAWKIRQTHSLAVAVPFAAGCAAEGYGEPDEEEKLLLMHETTVVIIQKGLETQAAKEKIEQLLFREFQREPERNLYDKTIARVRDALAQSKKPATSSGGTRAKGRGEVTPLHVAAQEGDVAATERLLAEGVDVNARQRLGMTALHYAAGWDNPECPISGPCVAGTGVSERHNQVAALLISHGANVDAEVSGHTTPLGQAAFCNAVGMAELFIDHGADINYRSGQYSVLEMASSRGPDAAVLLVEKGANVNTSDPYTLNTPLHVAAGCGYMELVDALLAHGADVNAKNQFGRTPIDNSRDSSVREALESYTKEKR